MGGLCEMVAYAFINVVYERINTITIYQQSYHLVYCYKKYWCDYYYYYINYDSYDSYDYYDDY